MTTPSDKHATTERGRFWAWYRRRFHLENNPYWEAREHVSPEDRREHWRLISNIGRWFLVFNLFCLGCAALVLFFERGNEPTQFSAIGSVYGPLGLVWMAAVVFVLPWTPLALWFRAVLLAGSERRREREWELLLTTPLTLRQVYWAKMTPVLREGGLFFGWLAASVVCLWLQSLIPRAVNVTRPSDLTHLLRDIAGDIGVVMLGLAIALFYLGGLLISGAVALCRPTKVSGLSGALTACLAIGLIVAAAVWNLSVEIDGLFAPEPADLRLKWITALAAHAGAAATLCLGPLYVRWLDRKRDPAGSGATSNRV